MTEQSRELVQIVQDVPRPNLGSMRIDPELREYDTFSDLASQGKGFSCLINIYAFKYVPAAKRVFVQVTGSQKELRTTVGRFRYIRPLTHPEWKLAEGWDIDKSYKPNHVVIVRFNLADLAWEPYPVDAKESLGIREVAPRRSRNASLRVQWRRQLIANRAASTQA